MKRILFLALLSIIVLGMEAQGKKILVTYFSWSNNTKALAEEIQRQTGADIYRIEPLESYTTDYQTLAYTIANAEKADNARPALKDTLRSMQDYDIVFVGCPVWWYDAPMIIHSFLECKDYDFKGKTIVPFCTFVTSTYQTLNDIVAATPDSEHLDGLGLRGASSYSEATVKEWLDRIGISDIVAGIESPSFVKNRQQQGIYNLQGQRVTSILDRPKGLYIMDGKKYLVK
jgi:flavodoxin